MISWPTTWASVTQNILIITLAPHSMIITTSTLSLVISAFYFTLDIQDPIIPIAFRDSV